ncbi:unnamed protein product [Urochloa humidicola]
MEFAVGASQSAMKSLVSKLGSLLAQEYALIRGVRGEIQDISHELASMMAFLRNLNADDPTAEHDHQTEDWMRQVSDMSYDIEDCVDHFAHHLCDEPRGNGCLVAVRRGVYELLSSRLRSDIAKKVAELKARAERVGERRVRYGVPDPNVSKVERNKDGSSRAGAYMENLAQHRRTDPGLYGCPHSQHSISHL